MPSIGFNLGDRELTVTRALPAGAATVVSTGIQLHSTDHQDFVADGELVVSAPALTTALLPDAQTVTYTVEHDNDPAFGTATTLGPGSGNVQTGAGGAGAAALELRIRPQTNVKKYVRLKIVKVGAADASTATATLQFRA